MAVALLQGMLMTETAAPASPELPPLRSLHTVNFPGLLAELGISLVVSTYQAGRLVLLRADGDRINTHFRAFDKPMGVAVAGRQLALGTTTAVWEFHDVPAVAAKLEPAGKHDACFLPRTMHATGDVQIHEMAWGSPSERSRDPAPQLWFVNTRFSCLCTRSGQHSFVPRWRPSFISALAPEDRCHLNGLGMVDGKPRYATALGRSDEPAGWRAHKKDGGILIDVPNNEIVLSGLSMPHSPRWHDEQLWLLDSGSGSFGLVDRSAGRYRSIVELPGFTRGLDFFGRYAFVGLSQVRETAVFSGISLTERLAERTCGVWVVDLFTGKTAAFLRFEDAVQEIFAVQVLHGLRYPDLINDDPAILANSFVLPDKSLAEVAAPFRGSGGAEAPPLPRG
jgi:uncharacterized protein (TIGR03032 family)